MQQNGFYPSNNNNAAGGDGGDNNEAYYYYYMMPDGTYGYAEAGNTATNTNGNNGNAMMTVDSSGNYYYPGAYSPAEVEMSYEQPTGYQEPTYGRGTGYNDSVPQQQPGGMTRTNKYNPSIPGSAVARQQQQQQQTEQQQQQYYYDANTGCYYYYDTSGAAGADATAAGAGGDAAAGAEATAGDGTNGDGAAAGGEEGQPQTLRPAGSFLYVPPQSFKEYKKFRGPNRWLVTGCNACPHRPCYCIGACLCPWCFVGAQRKRLLLNDWSNYLCCAGTCGRTCCKTHGCCQLCCELTWCLPCALRGNRAILMKHYSLQPTCCDKCINGFSCVCEVFRCCSKWSPSCCGWLYCCVLPCLLSQQEEQRVKLAYPANSAMA